MAFAKGVVEGAKPGVIMMSEPEVDIDCGSCKFHVVVTFGKNAGVKNFEVSVKKPPRSGISCLTITPDSGEMGSANKYLGTLGKINGIKCSNTVRSFSIASKELQQIFGFATYLAEYTMGKKLEISYVYAPNNGRLWSAEPEQFSVKLKASGVEGQFVSISYAQWTKILGTDVTHKARPLDWPWRYPEKKDGGAPEEIIKKAGQDCGVWTLEALKNAAGAPLDSKERTTEERYVLYIAEATAHDERRYLPRDRHYDT